MDIAALYAAAAASDPARPFITFYDDATGERTELSYLTFDNWVSKTANMLCGGFDCEPEDTAHIDLPTHWLTAAITVGTWRAGLTLTDAADADVAFHHESDAARLPKTPGTQRCLVSTLPLSIGLRDPEAKAAEQRAEAIDFLSDVRGHGDDFMPITPVTQETSALQRPGGEDWTQASLIAAASARADELGISAGQRSMFTDPEYTVAGMDWILVPLVTQGSVVVSMNSNAVDLKARAESENAHLVTS
ncbi:MAG TPA: TIGR03089 family protein [Candidatus Stackebrandtia faecavium]|nr:TIGR03089 family protein [Candidatus Stackebrandtia faecavium]